MKSLLSLAAAVALLVVGTTVNAEDVKSGLEVGKKVGPFYVTKCSTEPNDGVSTGQNLCYRCKYGANPMVMVFARQSDTVVATLAKQLDEIVAKNTDKSLKAFVNLMGTDKGALEKSAAELADANKLTSVPVVVPNEFENGPEDYGINPKAGVTVLVVSGQKVIANHAFSKLEGDGVKKVLADVSKALQ